MAQSFEGTELFYKTPLELLGTDAKKAGLKQGWAKPLQDTTIKIFDKEELWILSGGLCTYLEFIEFYNKAIEIYRPDLITENYVSRES